MSILIISIFVSVVVASYLLRVAVLSKGRQRKSCLIKAIAISVSAGALAMFTYFEGHGIDYQLGLMLFQLIMFSAVVFGIALLFALPTYYRKGHLQELQQMLQRIIEIGK